MPDGPGDVSWSSLPNKGQLAIVVIARFSEPVIRTSIWTYVFYQLQSLDPKKPADQIVRDAAMLQTVFTLAQGCTAVLWGHLADSPRGGRKLVLLISLGGSCLSTVAFGFIRNYTQAVILRLVEGAVNGNTAMIRTMVSEIVKERRYQAKAFVLMPMAYNIAAILSPMVAGLLADLAGQYPDTFGHVAFFRNFPYVPPAMASGAVAFTAWLLVFFHLKETHPEARHKYDLGLDLFSRITSLFTKKPRQPYTSISQNEPPGEESQQFLPRDDTANTIETTDDIEMTTPSLPLKPPRQRLPLSRMFTLNLCLTLSLHSILEAHFSVYNTLWPSFLSDPVATSNKARIHLPFGFVGGLGMPARKVAISLAFAGALGIPLQIFGYSRVVARLGMMRTFRMFVWGFPLVYFLVPYLSVVPSTTDRPEGREGAVVWGAIFVVQLMMMVSVSFVVPTQIALTNNSSPHPTALGRTHSAAEMLCSFTRTVSPIIAGSMYSYGTAHGYTGLPWWIMSAVTLVACVLSNFIYEGNGHEIRLADDEEEE